MTFSLEKMINATIYIGTRKKEKVLKKVLNYSFTESRGFVFTYTYGATFLCLQERVEIAVIMNLISNALSVFISKTPN